MTRRPRALLALLPAALLLAACAAGPDTDGGTDPPAATTSASAGLRGPAPGADWQWQLTGRLDLSVPADVYDVDLFTTSAAQVAALHARGRYVVCYLDAGGWEDFRPDAAAFPPAVRGTPMGWPGQRWLDVRRLDVLLPVLARRLDLCRDKGFDAVEPDDVDGYANDTGFPLTASDQLRFDRALAGLAHDRGLAVALKNDLDQVPELEPAFDFAVNEQCVELGECAALMPFVTVGKAVLHAEYHRTPAQFCATSRRLGLSSLQKRLDLDAWRRTC